jgi:pimeloyl-ACP methyl ester carboxylesterase
MRYFARLLAQLQDIVKNQTPGKDLIPPPLLSTVEINGNKVRYFHMGLANGEDPAIILIHGFGGFFMDWPRIMAPLAKTFHVYALDLPGWGFSELKKMDDAYAEVEMAQDVDVIKGFLEKNGIKSAYLVGVSYGAAVAWACGASKIHGLKGLLLLNPMPPFPLNHLKSPLYRMIFKLNRYEVLSHVLNRFLTKMQFKQVCKENLFMPRLLDSLYLELGYMVLKQQKVRNMLHLHSLGALKIDWQSWADKLKGIEIPVTILHGVNDRVFGKSAMDYLLKLMPSANYVELENCGHAMVFDQHRFVTHYILKHFQKNSDKMSA